MVRLCIMKDDWVLIWSHSSWEIRSSIFFITTSFSDDSFDRRATSLSNRATISCNLIPESGLRFSGLGVRGGFEGFTDLVLSSIVGLGSSKLVGEEAALANKFETEVVVTVVGAAVVTELEPVVPEEVVIPARAAAFDFFLVLC